MPGRATEGAQFAVIAEVYSSDAAAAAGFLDQIVPSSELGDAARRVAAELAKLDMAAHAATKLRARDHALKAIRAAIEADDASYRAPMSALGFVTPSR